MLPDRVRIPAPTFNSPRTPVPLANVPLKIVLVPLTPEVNVDALAPLLVTLPLPANEPTLSEKPPRSRSEYTVKAELELNPVAEPALSVPTLTVVAPV